MIVSMVTEERRVGAGLDITKEQSGLWGRSVPWWVLGNKWPSGASCCLCSGSRCAQTGRPPSAVSLTECRLHSLCWSEHTEDEVTNKAAVEIHPPTRTHTVGLSEVLDKAIRIISLNSNKRFYSTDATSVQALHHLLTRSDVETC